MGIVDAGFSYMALSSLIFSPLKSMIRKLVDSSPIFNSDGNPDEVVMKKMTKMRMKFLTSIVTL